jgi:hypothetical protein
MRPIQGLMRWCSTQKGPRQRPCGDGRGQVREEPHKGGHSPPATRAALCAVAEATESQSNSLTPREGGCSSNSDTPRDKLCSAGFARWPPTSADLDSDAGIAMPGALVPFRAPRIRNASLMPPDTGLSANSDRFGIPHPTASRDGFDLGRRGCAGGLPRLSHDPRATGAREGRAPKVLRV